MIVRVVDLRNWIFSGRNLIPRKIIIRLIGQKVCHMFSEIIWEKIWIFGIFKIFNYVITENFDSTKICLDILLLKHDILLTAALIS